MEKKALIKLKGLPHFWKRRRISALSLPHWRRRRGREGSNEERLRDWLCLRRPCPLVSQIALTVYITFGLARSRRAMYTWSLPYRNSRTLLLEECSTLLDPFLLKVQRHLLPIQGPFLVIVRGVCVWGGERPLPPVIKVVRAFTPQLGFCLDQTEPALWSRQTRDKEVSGRTLASFGVSFTRVKEAQL